MSRKNFWKRTMAGVLSALMVLSSMPMMSFAAEVPVAEDVVEYTTIEEETDVVESTVVEETVDIVSVEPTTECQEVEVAGVLSELGISLMEGANWTACFYWKFDAYPTTADSDARLLGSSIPLNDCEYVVVYPEISTVDERYDPNAMSLVVHGDDGDVTYRPEQFLLTHDSGIGDHKVPAFVLKVSDLVGSSATVMFEEKGPQPDLWVNITEETVGSWQYWIVDSLDDEMAMGWGKTEDAYISASELGEDKKLVVYVSPTACGRVAEGAALKTSKGTSYGLQNVKGRDCFVVDYKDILATIGEDGSGSYIDVTLPYTNLMSLTKVPTGVSVSFVKGVKNGKVAFGDGIELKVTKTPAGTSAKSVSLVPYTIDFTTTPNEENYGTPIELTEEDGVYKISANDLVTGINNAGLPMPRCNGLKVEVKFEVAKYEITNSSSDVYFYKCEEDGSTKGEALTTTVESGDTIYFAATAIDGTHFDVATVTKKSGTATLTQKKTSEGFVYYELKDIKSNIILNATKKRVALAEQTGFTINNNTYERATVKVTGAVYNATEKNYTINPGATTVTVAITEAAPYTNTILNNIEFAGIGEHPELVYYADTIKLVSGKYVHTYVIPAVDIADGASLNIYDARVNYVTKIAYKERWVDISAKIDGVDAEPYADETGLISYSVPFGSKLTIIPVAKDNCKVLNIMDGTKKVAVPKTGYTVTVLKSRDDISVTSEALLKTVVTGIAADKIKGNVYSVNKENADVTAFIQMGSDEFADKLDLRGKTIEAKVGTKAVSVVSLDENNTDLKFDFSSDDCAGKTVVVTIKEDRNVLSTMKFNVTPYVTSVAVKGEKAVNEGGNKLQLITQDYPLNKSYAVTFNKGVNPNDVTITSSIVGPESSDASSVISYANGKLEVNFYADGDLMDSLFTEDGKLRRIEVKFYDTTKSGDTPVSTKYIQPSLDYLKKLKPTVKVVSATDTKITISLDYPKQLKGYEGAYKYRYTAVAANSEECGTVLKANVEDPGNLWLSDVATGTLIDIDFAKDGVSEGQGKEAKYNIDVCINFVDICDTSSVTLNNQKTKNPAYETKIGAKVIQANIYAGEKNVDVAKATYTAKTTHFGIASAKLIKNFDDKAIVDDSGVEGTKLAIDGDSIVITDTTELEAGKYNLVIYAKQEEGKEPSSKTIPITIFEPIRGVYITIPAHNITSNNARFYKDNTKALTIVPKAVATNSNAKTKVFKWSMIAIGSDGRKNEELTNAITFNSRTGSITINKNYVPVEMDRIKLLASAGDFDENSAVNFETVIWLTPQKAPFDEISVKIGSGETARNVEAVAGIYTVEYKDGEDISIVVEGEKASEWGYVMSSSTKTVADIENIPYNYIGKIIPVKDGLASFVIKTKDATLRTKTIKIRFVKIIE